MQRLPVSSTDIASIGYDADNAILEIEFHNGGIYHYFNVSGSIYNGVMGATSHGKYFNEEIKGRYQYRKID